MTDGLLPTLRTLWVASVLTLGLITPLRAEWFHDEQALMGTRVFIEVWSDNALHGRSTIDAVLAELRRIDRAMSVYRAGSEVSRVNVAAAERAVVVSQELFALLQRAAQINDATEGAFDVTYAAAGQLYDYRSKRKPDSSSLTAAVANIGADKLILDESTRSVKFARRGVRIDLGGIAKGYAVERGARVLRANDVQYGQVTAGGDSRFVGSRAGRPWQIAIRDPRHSGRTAALLPIQDEALSTSGDYERFFIEGEIRYHHILNPQTGRSPDAVMSVSVLGPDATTTDALATGLFVLGVARGLQVIESFSGYDAIFIDSRGELHFSANISRQDRKSEN